RSNYWSGKMTYSYQQTKGKSSDPNEQGVVQEGGGTASEVPLGETFVDWNRPHKLTANLDIRFDKEAPQGWMRYFGINLYVQGESGRAYTPVNPAFPNEVVQRNSKNAPFQVTTDVRIDRSVGIGGRRLDVSVTGINIFNNYLIYRVDPQTGRGRVWGVGS